MITQIIVKSHQIFIITSIFMSIFLQNGLSQHNIVYKSMDSIILTMNIYYPQNMVKGEKYPAMIFFFGGGWRSGNMEQFKPHAEFFSKRGIICAIADYRVNSRHNTTPFESLKDAKSAIRFLRSNSDKFHIDPDKIIASGGSAGGHLAAATATIDMFNDPKDNLNISPKPNALVLFNPVLDNGPGGVGFDRIKDAYLYFSPLHNLRKGAPPTILFLGTNDRLIPVETFRYYRKVMDRIGSRCDLHLYDGQPHGFFNYRNIEYYNKTVSKTDEFLVSLGYISQSHNR